MAFGLIYGVPGITAKLFQLNKTAKSILKSLDDGFGKSDIVKELTIKYKIEEQKILIIVNQFLAELEKEGIIVVSDGK